MLTQKLSMNCTKEQYEKHLRQELLKIGYKEHNRFYWEKPENQFIEACEGLVGTVGKACVKRIRTHIGIFNPPLFLARAAMNDNKYGGYGEYWTFVGGEKKGFTKGDIYRCVDLIPSPTFINDVGIKVNFIEWELFFSMFRKSTAEEIEQSLGLTSLVSSIKKRNDDIPREEEDAIMLLKDRKYRIFKEEINLREV